MNPNPISFYIMMKKLFTFLCVVFFFNQEALAIDLKSGLLNSGGDLLKAATLSEKEVIAQSLSAMSYIDTEASMADAKYQDRLNKIVARVKLPEIEGVTFNFKVYNSDPNDLNAFATPDGSIRFHTAIMDAMTDDQLLAVLGHEIGHVVEKHSFKQTRKALLASAGISAAASQSGTAADLYNIGGGELANKFFQSTFSKGDEISADKYSLKVLSNAGAKPEAMKEAIQVLQEKYGNGGGMLSSHPSNKKRIKKLDKAIAKMK